MRCVTGLALALGLAACGQETAVIEAPPATPVALDPLAPPQPSSVTVATSPQDAWLGRWLGPEGLFLQIDPAGQDVYRLTLRDNLDSQAVYEARAEAGALSFTRAGVVQTIRPGTGAETGFKWLADKQDCLIVIMDQEGYCRD
jgi:hypothetical protein